MWKSACVVINALVTLMCIANAKAEWRHDVFESDFDGSKSSIISENDHANGAILGIIPDEQTGQVRNDYPGIILRFTSSHFCSSGDFDEELIDWILKDENGKIFHRGTDSTWTLSASRDTFIADRQKYGNPSSTAAELLSAMLDNRAREIRFQFVDACGNVSITAFSLDGFVSSLNKVQAENALE